MRTMRVSNNEMLPVITLIGVMTLTGTVQAPATVACNHKELCGSQAPAES